MAYLPGTEGGAAVADVIFGNVNPSGHLPVTWPSASDHMAGDFDTGGPSTPGDEPKFFDQLPGTNSGPGSGYNPRWRFGFGLSYTTFTTSGLSASPSSVSRHGTETATFTVSNTGSRAGTAVVPGLRASAGEHGARAAAAARRLGENRARGRRVPDRARLVPGLPARGHRRRHRRQRPARRGTRPVPGAGRLDERRLHGQLTSTRRRRGNPPPPVA